MTVNLLAVSFADRSTAFEALSRVKRVDAEGRARLLSAAVLERDADGQLRIAEGADNTGSSGLVTGSLVGLLVGVLGGPLGMLFGWGAGALIGSSSDMDRAATNDELMSEVSRAIPAGSNALVAEVDEYAQEVLDSEMSALHGTLLRRSAGDVLAELEAAQAAADEAEEKQRHAAKEQKKAESHARYEERKTKLREALHLS